MKYYNPDEALNVSEWLTLDEHQKIKVVSDFHRQFGYELPDPETVFCRPPKACRVACEE